MRAFRKSFSMFAAAVISLVAVSCSLFGDEEPSAERNFVEPALTASVSGSVKISGAAPGALRSSAARTALPSLNGVSYSVEASDGGVRTRRKSMRKISRSRSRTLRLLRAGLSTRLRRRENQAAWQCFLAR